MEAFSNSLVGFFVAKKGKMTIQSYEPAVRLIRTRIKATKKRGAKTLSVASVFKMLRENHFFGLFGDYPLLAITVDEIQNNGFSVRRDSLFKTMNKSEELRGIRQKIKTELVDQLLNTYGEHFKKQVSRGTGK